jgi:hypothetical protein
MGRKGFESKLTHLSINLISPNPGHALSDVQGKERLLMTVPSFVKGG